jgi:hypothetical protein
MNLTELIGVCYAYGVELTLRFQEFTGSMIFRFYYPPTNMFYQQAISLDEILVAKNQEYIMKHIIDDALRTFEIDK